ncbi:ParB/RepB/Spo0J family partition protein [Aminithiophilus ramosus]|uniref:ParB/RepB/Spo0J family partition protein n=2 Tax=Synergistales TaxID=649776 RepID=A0A9Q7APJ2_9BACT|nr:ParB/RepB/Spo0J family partition protein [Aminithiophilus ramosus]QTX33142.1 ParB/RepB/Spo0J family partition protein [Aminithiophilus ramosus]QVL37096.1 ParB/RepB/Spo0J family partition protein [Synergistota bacterium]
MGSRYEWDVARFLNASPPARKEVPKTVSGEADAEAARFVEVPIEALRPNPFQPRQHFDEEELEELAQSIRSFGLIQPVVVRRLGSGAFELIAGERRLRACERAGWKTIPAVVTEADEATQQVLALVENLQRRDLSAAEEARSYSGIMERTGWSQIELARRLGRSQGAIANKLRLLRLPEPVLDLIVSGRLSERQARALLPLPAERQIDLARRAVDEGLRVRELEGLVAEETAPAEAETPREEPKEERRTEPLSKSRKRRPSPEVSPPVDDDGFLKALADLVERARSSGRSVQWKVREEGQRERVVEIRMALHSHGPEAEERS